MQYKFSAEFLAEIVLLAKKIAFHQRGERELQDIDILEEKFAKELKELSESEHPEEELPDVVYYGCCLAAHGQYMCFLNLVELDILPRYPYSQQKIESITLAKYRIRAEGPNSKDFERERKAIQNALG